MTGIWYALAAAVLLGVSPLFMKSGIRKTKPKQAAIIWTLAMSVICFLFREDGWSLKGLGTETWLCVIFGGIALGAGLLATFYAFRDGMLIHVYPLLYVEGVLSYVLHRILNRSFPGWIVVAILVVILVGVILMMIVPKGRNTKRWLLYSLLAMACYLLSDYLLVYRSSYAGSNGGKALVFLIATVFLLLTSVEKGMLQNFREIYLVDGILLVIGSICLFFSWRMGSRAGGSYIELAILHAGLLLTYLGSVRLNREKPSAVTRVGLLLLMVGLWIFYGAIPIPTL